jgi:hypothetical protein
VRLYTLHQIEGPADLILLRIRIETLSYSFAPLVIAPRGDIDSAYAEDPRAGAERVRQTVLPRLQTLLDTRDPLRELGEDQDARWRRYAAERGLTAPRIPVIRTRIRPGGLPARSQTAERLAQVSARSKQCQTAAETASTLAALCRTANQARAAQIVKPSACCCTTRSRPSLPGKIGRSTRP